MIQNWGKYSFSELVNYTKKPRTVELASPIPFIPMGLIPNDRIEIDSYNEIQDLTSGTFVENGDLLLAKITPSFENGKQGILNIDKSYAYATTEVIPFKAKQLLAETLYIAFYLKRDDIRKYLADKMEGSTGRQRLSKHVLDNLEISIPPLPEQRRIAYILSTVQKAIEQQDKLIRATTELKKALMQKLFTEGIPRQARDGAKGEKQKMTEIGPVPESWDIVELGKYAFIENGFAFKSQDYIKDGIPLIRISNVSHGFFIHNDNKYLPKSYLQTYSKFALKDGDLIISLTRPVTSGGLKYCFVENKDLPALLNQRVGRFQIRNKEKLSKEYLYHLVFSNYFVGELFKLFGNSSQQPNVSPSQLESFKVPIPPLEEQIRIAHSLSLLFNKVRKAEQKKLLLNELFLTLLHELMTGARRVHEIDFPLMPKN